MWCVALREDDVDGRGASSVEICQVDGCSVMCDDEVVVRLALSHSKIQDVLGSEAALPKKQVEASRLTQLLSIIKLLEMHVKSHDT